MKASQVTQLIPKKELDKVNTVRQLRIKNVALAIAEIFQRGEYISAESAISQRDLFYEIFGKWQKQDDLADELRWEYARRGMHYLRRNTKCFIGSLYTDGQRHYFVVKNEEDANYYIELLNNAIKKMKYMQKRAMQSVDQEWWKLVRNGEAIPEKLRHKEIE